jgi:tetratricopeptide (TPR) repeat protein
MAIETVNECEGGRATLAPSQEYARLLRELHSLIAQGTGDTDEAEQIRDLMDDPWNQLSEQDVRRVRGLSADLYTLHDPVAPQQHLDQQEIEEFNHLSGTAAKNNDWDRVLELLREHPHALSPDTVAYIRAVSWDNFGDLETALVFLRKAVSLSPSNYEYLSFYIFALIKTGRVADALSVADRIVNDSEFVRPELIYKVADALFGSAHGCGNAEKAKPIVTKVIAVIQKAVENEKRLPEHERSAASTVAAHVKLGMCYSLLGNHDLALGAYNFALRLDPTNDVALIGRGTIRLRSKQPSSIDDFKQAVQTETTFVWPYYCYGRFLVETGQFDECLRICRAGLRRTNEPSVMAEFYEMIAISQDALGERRETVRSNFETARSLAPLNQQIEQNYQLFIKSSAPANGTFNWNLEWERDLEEASREFINQYGNQVGRWAPAA